MELENDNVLKISGLNVALQTEGGPSSLVHNLSFGIKKGKF